MQPPIPIGTILQNRYRLINILGQGGFGRTYLAEDTGRFNERCALKEFIPLQTNAHPVTKSQELFSREAAILYQIQHPQIPKFRATFEENQRLFLLQDYIEGKTYRSILQERQITNSLFSEAEVLTFLQQILPVLAHIHSFGIIHRDISPDNIIRRESDQMPVLIDFGVVKELATKIQSSHLVAPLTNVGKFGYAPWEQIQLGRATANSDLHALAVTVVVLLTGKEPQQLIDQTTLTWNWQRWVAVSPGLAEMINRMLSHQPGDRYQSVTEVEQALERLPHIKSQQLPTINQEQNNPSPSQQPTVGATPNQNLNPNHNDSFFDNQKWVVPALVAVLVVLSGIVSWSAVNFFLKRRQQEPQLQQPTKINPIPVPTLPPPSSSPIPTSSPSPTTTSTPSPTLPSPSPVVPAPSAKPEVPVRPLPTSTPIPETPTPVIIPSPSITSEERLNVFPGEPISIEGRLKGNESIDYIISGSQRQNLNLLVTGEGVLMSLVAVDGEPVDGISDQVSIWKGTLPNDGDYKITLTPLPGLPGTDYKLDINLVDPIPKVIPTSEPEATESPTPTQEPEATESPSSLQLNKPSKKQIKKSFPISTPLEELDKPSKKPKKQIVIPETEITPSPTPAEETSSDSQILIE
ncbi:MAG: serine/threonine protein kinase [Okeania sp. SIO3B5]|uniref:serine/threonine-protein kinase n=1 Tax=Okeania sp. SIO3B5 TaxID=2607811 RepID=UPI0013FF28C0|nr:serine/threonine-protein kinase [Okeania sp. SIO3B5]NEO53053.1 serine/threonine protein kinase [Okeania sp. SIO3B5]